MNLYHFKITIVAAFALAFTACGGGSDDNPTPTLQSGNFIDSAVEGLRFESATQSGITDANGKFLYITGETVRFYIGDILLGASTGQQTVTPLDLVAGANNEENATVTNIARFLQTLDENNNSNDGIKLTVAIQTTATGKTIDFEQSIEDFEVNVSSLLSELTGAIGNPRALIQVNTAQSHLQSSLLASFESQYNGTYNGDDSGTWSMNFDDSGNITGTACPAAGGSILISGTVSSNGESTVSGSAGESTFSGIISPNGVFSGTWNNSTENDNGSFTGRKTSGAANCSATNTNNDDTINKNAGSLTASGDIVGGSYTFTPVGAPLIEEQPLLFGAPWGNGNISLSSQPYTIVYVVAAGGETAISFYQVYAIPESSQTFSLSCKSDSSNPECNKFILNDQNNSVTLNNAKLTGTDETPENLSVTLNGTLYWYIKN